MNTQSETWTTHQGAPANPLEKFDLMSRLPVLLHILATAALLIAMYSFLVKGWQSGNDVFRYLLMLAHTGFLTAVGIASGHWLKESKGARLLLTLALVSIPANFAILGAFIFSQSGGIDVSQYPHYVAWTVDSLSTALLTSGGALLVLLPVTLLGFTVLARSMSKKLSLLFLVSNATLLLPLRDPHLVSLLVLLLTFCIILFNYKTAHQQLAAKTREGITALALQFLPLTVLMGRSLWLYSFDLFLMTVLALTVFYIFRQATHYLEKGSKTHNYINGLSLIPAIAIIPLLSSFLFELTLVTKALIIPFVALVSACMIYDISRRSRDAAVVYRYVCVGILVFCMVSNLFIFTGLLAALVCIAVGLGLLVLGFQKRQQSIFTSGTALMLVGIAQQLYEVIHHFDIGSWASLAVLGVFAIVIASAIESQGGKIKPHIERWKSTFKDWER